MRFWKREKLGMEIEFTPTEFEEKEGFEEISKEEYEKLSEIATKNLKK